MNHKLGIQSNVNSQAGVINFRCTDSAGIDQGWSCCNTPLCVSLGFLVRPFGGGAGGTRGGVADTRIGVEMAIDYAAVILYRYFAYQSLK